MWRATPDGIFFGGGGGGWLCNETHNAIAACDAIHRQIERRGSTYVEPWSCHASAAFKPPPPLFFRLPFLCLFLCLFFFFFFSPSAVRGAYLQVSAGVAGRLPSRHFTAALLPRTAHSFPGFVQSTTALLPLSCHPAPSALHRSLSTRVWEGGPSVHVCVCGGREREWERERDRERGRVRVGEGWRGCKYVCALSLECTSPLTSTQKAWTSCLSGFVL